MGKIIVEGTEEELKRVTGPAGVRVSAYNEPDTKIGEEEAKAKLAEEVKGQLSEKDAEIERLNGELEAKLAEEPEEPSDEERFDALVDDLKSLTVDGKARLAETTGWTYQMPAPEETQPENKVDQQTKVPKIRFVVRAKAS